MDIIEEPLVRKALSVPSLRQNIMNAGTVFLYCDYAGFTSPNVYGAACCMVHNRTITVSAWKLPIEQDQGSIYGEMMAIVLSLNTLTAAIVEHNKPKVAVIYTDCSRIARLLVQDHFSRPHDERGRNELLTALTDLRRQFPDLDVQIKYIRQHKKNNHLHRLAHNAAREVAFS